MIPQNIIDDIRRSTDIVDLIADYVKLHPSGRNYKALSPFTQEKTPSFVVSPDKQIFKCFSTGKGGNVYTFVMEMEKISFPEAVELLAKRTGIDISRFTKQQKIQNEENESQTGTLRWAARTFHNTLESPKGVQGLSYLTEARGLSRAIIQQFGIGYAPDQWDNLINEAKQASIPLANLTELGLTTHHKERGSWYDTFRNRVIFPIFSIGGQVAGFGGRTLDSDPRTPKYLNSPENPLFEKSKLLYGLHAAKDEIRRSESALLVEGYMDVLALHQAGITTAVASCGTSLTRYQAKILQRYTNRVLFVYDADPAGKKSMMAGIDTLVTEGITPFVLELPSGDDPDSFVQRAGKEEFLRYSEKNKQSFIDFQIRFFTQSGNFAQTDVKAKAIRAITHTIALIPDRIRQELYLQELSEKLGISFSSLKELLVIESTMRREKNIPGENSMRARPTPVPEKKMSVLERTFLKALLESSFYGNAVLEFAASHENMLTLPNPLAQNIFTHLIRRYHSLSGSPNDHLDIISEISMFSEPEARNLASGLLLDQPVSKKWHEQTDLNAENARQCLASFLDAFKSLVLEPLIRQKEILTEQIRNENDAALETELLREKITLDRKIRKTSDDLRAMIRSIIDNR
ncbi:DNA primase [Chlorobium phaeobacteroides]|nr:DNA primase [Chlorobium phaeobacteroides]MBV5326286.1 DNA primase [Chlorobium sp.]